MIFVFMCPDDGMATLKSRMKWQKDLRKALQDQNRERPAVSVWACCFKPLVGLALIYQGECKIYADLSRGGSPPRGASEDFVRDLTGGSDLVRDFDWVWGGGVGVRRFGGLKVEI